VVDNDEEYCDTICLLHHLPGGGPICGGGGCKVPGRCGNDPGGGIAKSGGGMFMCGGRCTDIGTEMMLVTGAKGCCGGLQ